jgi:hypothetical protein
MEILARRFGKKIKLPPTVQIKREILLRWLADQTEIEAAKGQEGPLRDWRRHGQRWRKGRPVIAGSELHLIGFRRDRCEGGLSVCTDLAHYESDPMSQSLSAIGIIINCLLQSIGRVLQRVH